MMIHIRLGLAIPLFAVCFVAMAIGMCFEALARAVAGMRGDE